MTTTEAIPSSSSSTSSSSSSSSSYSLDAYIIVHHTQAERRKDSDSCAGATMQQAENSWKPHVNFLPILPLVFLLTLLVPLSNSDLSHLNWPLIDASQDAVDCS